ncbi:MAG: NAD/FAD-utilizing enzyme [Gammaproteobacteria bacterium]|nr:NAD/FAD-utilizing enzyme [Gammaproteobacteria bacterium]MCZ6668228.1 NAD/FAD-utilizing enzyme [Gammaproteobacteria bacterium]
MSDDLDDLDRIKVELEANGVHKAQIHVFSKDDTGVETHDHLHNMESVFKNDVVHSTITGAWIGAAIATPILVVTWYSNWPETYTWMPFIFLAIVMLGFGAWAGGLYGIQEPHQDFKRFESQLRAGKHVFIADVDEEQESSLDLVVKAHPGLQLAGTGKATPRWVVMCQHNIKKFTSDTFP